ncbi:hypothetical protein AB5I41_11995 [Sphingomonas sp. MMS24-JH45]
MTPPTIVAALLALAVLVAGVRLARLARVVPGWRCCWSRSRCLRGSCTSRLSARAGRRRRQRADGGHARRARDGRRGAARGARDRRAGPRSRHRPARASGDEDDTGIGEGLEARDRDAVRGYGVASNRRRRGPDWSPWPRLRRWRRARNSGSAARRPGWPAGAHLLDPAGAVVDTASLDARGGFVLLGAARVPGVMLYRVRVRDAAKREVDAAEVPVVVAAPPALRALFLAGAPGPEVKYTGGAGRAMPGSMPRSASARGRGSSWATRPPRLVPPRWRAPTCWWWTSWCWTALAAQGAVLAAVRGGMGLVVRVTGRWRSGCRARRRSPGAARSRPGSPACRR